MFGFDAAAIALSIIFYRKLKESAKLFIFILDLLVIGLSIGALVNWILTAAGVASFVLVWVAMGLTLGCLFASVATIILVMTLRERRQSLPRVNQATRSNAAPTRNYDYIEEIKRLKELLDCQAITQEEFDHKKKELLDLK